MSDVHDAEADSTFEIDLSDVPMDGQQRRDEDLGEGGDGAEGEEGGQAQQRAPLEREELERRYGNSRTALQQERRERRQEREAFERRIEALERGIQPNANQRQPVEEEEIDPDVDPIGAMKQMRAKIKAYEAAGRQEELSAGERQAQERAFTQVETQLQDHEADFRDEHPDYDDAAKHYSQARIRELAAFGLSPQQIGPVLREEFVRMAQTAMRARKNPAAVVYELAKGRGYSGTGQVAKPGKPQGVRGADGRFTKLDTVADGQAATSPLSRAGGSARGVLDVRTVANIDTTTKKGAEAFDKYFDELERREKAAERGR